MASSLIHLAVAKELGKHINIKKYNDYVLGSVAPDISKTVGLSRTVSHFATKKDKDNPNLDRFKEKYPNYMENSFNLGYFVHLYTDKVWYGEFTKDLIKGNTVCLLDGVKIKVKDEEEIKKIVYQDYSNVNTKLLDYYNMDLAIFYEEFRKPESEITEIPVERLDELLNQLGIIIENTRIKKAYVFDMNLIVEFVAVVVERLLKELEPIKKQKRY